MDLQDTLQNIHRPDDWSGVIGQEHMIPILQGIVENGSYKYTRSYIFAGCLPWYAKLKARVVKGLRKGKITELPIASLASLSTRDSVTAVEVETPYGMCRIKRYFFTGEKECLRITTSEGNTLDVATTHLIQIPHPDNRPAFVLAEHLYPGLEISSVENKAQKIVSIEPLGVIPTFDIEVDNPTMRYIYNGAIHHNSPGSGKTTTGRILANAIVCDAKDGRPCHECESCRLFARNSYPDYIEVDAGQYNKVEDVKQLIDIAKLYPIHANKNRIILIDEAHRLSNAAWDSMLKLLEEGVTKTIFIFATTEGDKIRRAIHSRSLSFKVKPLSVNEILKELIRICKASGIEFDTPSLESIAYANQGRMRDAIKTLDMYVKAQGNALNIAVHTDEERFCNILKLAFFNNIDEATRELDKVATASHDIGSVLCNTLASIYCYPQHHISGIPESVLGDMKELFKGSIKSLIQQFMEYKPQTYEQVKLFLLIIAEAGVTAPQVSPSSSDKPKEARKRVLKREKQLEADDEPTPVQTPADDGLEDF